MTGQHPSLAGSVAGLIDQFHKLPGIGPKTAQRLTYYLVRMPPEEAHALADAITALKERITLCSQCQNITEEDPCPICTDPARDAARICVVEEPMDVMALERTGAYKGRYHVLHGVISPMSNVGPDDLRIRELVDRLKDGAVQELVLATNPNVEAEATAMYIHRLVSGLVPSITRLARGLPVGGDLEYADELTLARAFEGRQPF